MHISNRPIGIAHPVYVIAEIGVNHDGCPERALELTRLAAASGADAVKFQLFEADRLMSRSAKLAAYQKAAGETDPIEMLRRLELTIEQMAPCVMLAHERGIHAIVSVFSVELVEVAERLPWDAYKTASPDIVNKPLLDALAATGKPLIVSTGASTLDEVKRCVGWMRAMHERLALLQCVSSYPTPVEFAAYSGITALRAAYSGPVGYSDHVDSEESGGHAVTFGAEILEKHFTYSRRAHGPDHGASLEPARFLHYRQLADLAHASREETASRVQHSSVKEVLHIEQDVRTVSRQSLTTTRNLHAGQTLTRADLTIKRPGSGIPPYELDDTLTRTLARYVPADTPLTPDDLVLSP